MNHGIPVRIGQQFAKSLGLDLKVKVVKDEEQLVSSLLKGEGDLVAYNLIITNPLKDSLIYCGEEDITRQVIIQRRGKKALKDVTELVGKKVYVNSGKYRTRLENLNRELEEESIFVRFPPTVYRRKTDYVGGRGAY